MATTQATKRVARRGQQLLNYNKTKYGGRKGHAISLIYSMHSQLYPGLKPESKGQSKVSEQEDGGAKRDLKGGTRWIRQLAEDKNMRELQVKYTDTKIENAVRHTKNIIMYKPKAPIRKTCADPVSLVSDAQMKRLDPTGARTRLFAKMNPERACVGDILLVRQRTGEPFAGVCINIRRRGVDTAILLRGQLTRVGVEMWFKVYSPLVEGIEVVQRAAKRARRARLTYMRKPKHDRGSVENVVRVYMRQKAALGTADGKKKGANMGQMGKKGVNKRGKHRR